MNQLLSTEPLASPLLSQVELKKALRKTLTLKIERIKVGTSGMSVLISGYHLRLVRFVTACIYQIVKS